MFSQAGKAPLYEAVISHLQRRTASFHVPGHKSGRGLDPEAESWLGAVMEIDLTEITGLDDLHHPEGAIQEAQTLAAECFGAEQTFFLVGGSTVGNLAMILSVCNRGDLLIVQRNSHKSVIHGLMLAGAKAVFVAPRTDSGSGLPGGVDADDVMEALERYPEAKAVLLTNPNYYGWGSDVRRIADIVHAHGKPLLVDEAHGAHYGFHEKVPMSAIQCGADAVVQSTHKMLTSLTMGAMLHIQGARVDRERVKQRLGMLQSSSPSYPILVSLDLARRWMQRCGAQSIAHGLEAVSAVMDGLNRSSRFQAAQVTSRPPGIATKDPFKVAICDRTGTLTGFQIKAELEERECMIEMADPKYALCVFSLASETSDAERLLAALQDICRKMPGEKKELPPILPNSYNIEYNERVSEPVFFDKERAGTTQSERIRIVDWSDAPGNISAEMIVPYPPGIPILFPGERITASTAEYLRRLAGLGAKFQGASDPGYQTVRVYSK